jgi:hypothetical protein
MRSKSKLWIAVLVLVALGLVAGVLFLAGESRIASTRAPIGASPPPPPRVGEAAPPRRRSHAAPGPDQVDQEISQLRTAQVAFNVPSTMKRGDATEIELLLDMHKTVEQLKAQIEAEGARSGAQVRISDRMEATLSGAHFQITPNEPGIRAIGSSDTVRWSWEVVPTATGEQTLHLTLSAYIDVDQTQTPTVIRTVDRAIKVRVSPTEWAADALSEHWDWFLSTLVIPAGLVGWKRWKRWRRRRLPTS